MLGQSGFRSVTAWTGAGRASPRSEAGDAHAMPLPFLRRRRNYDFQDRPPGSMRGSLPSLAIQADYSIYESYMDDSSDAPTISRFDSSGNKSSAVVYQASDDAASRCAAGRYGKCGNRSDSPPRPQRPQFIHGFPVPSRSTFLPLLPMRSVWWLR